MSDIAITVELIQSVEDHPDADRLDVVKILGTQCVVPKGQYNEGQKVVYFPPNMVIPEKEADKLGVKKYLKHVRVGDKKIQGRVAACRIRGVPSYGFLAPLYIGELYTPSIGEDVTDWYNGTKYEPPEPSTITGGVPGGCRFGVREGALHRYTNIKNYYRYPGTFDLDERVIVTEKIHGTNSRVGVIFENGEWVYAAGSHKVRRAESKEGNRYWNPLKSESMLNMLATLCNESANIVVFGEIFGPSVQDMDYGVEGDNGYCVYDISVDGRYLNWLDVRIACQGHGVDLVPTLFEGPWKLIIDHLDSYASGQTSIGPPVRKFKGREGIVIKPTTERLTRKIDGEWAGGHRAILKYLSVDYLDRKGAQDNA